MLNVIPNKRSDLRPVESGWQYSVNWCFGVPILPWICFASRHFTFYIGWEPRGGFGILLNFSNSDQQVEANGGPRRNLHHADTRSTWVLHLGFAANVIEKVPL